MATSTPDEMIEMYRKSKNQQMLDGAASPLTAEQIQRFKGLSYYAIDAKYRIDGRFSADLVQKPVSLGTSAGGKIDLVKYGTVSFNWDGKSYSLNVFRNNSLPEFTGNSKQLFIPFTDLTNGKETFGGGRYLPVEAPVEGITMVIDFNRAMNPFNGYNDNNPGILAPTENQLAFLLYSGERKYEDR